MARENLYQYVVAAGDTLSKIGQKFTVDWRVVANLNNIDDPNQINVGQVLVLPFTGQPDVVEPPPGNGEPPPPGGWGDGVAWGARPDSAKIHLYGERGGVIQGHRFADIPYAYDGTNQHVGVMLVDCHDVTIMWNDFENMGQPIALVGDCQRIVVQENRAKNITGPSTRHGVQSGNFLQTVGGPSDIEVVGNKVIGGDTEDIISGYSARGMRIARNHIQGAHPDVINGGWTSGSGTGIILADGGGSDQIVEDNVLYMPGQVGIGIPGGQNCTVRRNIVYQLSQSPRAASNVGIYSYNHYGQPDFGPHEVYENRTKVWSDTEGVWNGWYTDGANVTERDNVWNDDTIDTDLLPVRL